jgi:hypothetical protein
MVKFASLIIEGNKVRFAVALKNMDAQPYVSVHLPMNNADLNFVSGIFSDSKPDTDIRLNLQSAYLEKVQGTVSQLAGYHELISKLEVKE